jgi:pimeloyl-ACP methyl ester carboxylesterase
MSIPTLPGVTARVISTPRLTTRVLFSGPDDGTPVLFLHGNTSSATWWEEVMLSLPHGLRGIAPDQRGFGDAESDKHIDATRGMGDLADDALALLDYLGLAKVHVVGNSLGGSVVWRLLMDAPGRFLTVTLVDPGSPYGFGSTRDEAGTPCWPDFAGSGGGLANPELIKRIREGDRSTDSPFSPRAALRTIIVKPPFIPAREEELVSSMLALHLGPQDMPGDAVASPNWPFVAPGVWGAANGLSPKYAGDVTRLYTPGPKAPILWIRGAHDLAVSDSALSDPGTLGQMGLIPGWPGLDMYPPQPMLRQTRAVLEKYADTGGAYQEVVLAEAGHAPYLEQLEAFNQAVHAHLRR